MEKQIINYSNIILPFVERELRKRKSRNSSYSLRALSRDLGINSSDLSKILTKKIVIGERLFYKLGKGIGLKTEELSQLVISYLELDEKFDDIEVSSFDIFSDWRSFAILELIHIKDLALNREELSERVCLTKNELESYLKRLSQAGFIEVVDGRIIDTTSGHSTTTHFASSNKALKDMQEGILNQAIKALHKTPFERRDQSSITVATTASKLIKAKSKIKKFRRDLMTYLEDTEKPDTVYQLSVSLFPIE